MIDTTLRDLLCSRKCDGDEINLLQTAVRQVSEQYARGTKFSLQLDADKSIMNAFPREALPNQDIPAALPDLLNPAHALPHHTASERSSE